MILVSHARKTWNETTPKASYHQCSREINSPHAGTKKANLDEDTDKNKHKNEDHEQDYYDALGVKGMEVFVVIAPRKFYTEMVTCFIIVIVISPMFYLFLWKSLNPPHISPNVI